MSIQQRVHEKRLLDRVADANKAVSIIRDAMTVATTGNAFSGFPLTLLLAMARALSVRKEKVTLFCAGALGNDIEEEFDRGDVVGRRLGSLGSPSARKAVAEGRLAFLDVKSGVFPLQVARGDFGPVDVALIEAVAITPDGHIVPSTALIDSPRWVQCAKKVLVEINPWVPEELVNFHDVFLPDPAPYSKAIPLFRMDQRIGTSHIEVAEDKIYAIVETADPMPDPGRSESITPVNRQIAEHFIRFLDSQVKSERLPSPPPPLEVGIGDIADAVIECLKESEFKDLNLYLPGVTDRVLDLMDEGKVAFVSATNLRMGKKGLERFFSALEAYRHIILRPLDILNSGDVIRRMNVIALNTAIEIDIQGQVNSSHLMGVRMVGGIGGSYDYSRNARLSVFLTPSTTQNGNISCIVPLVAHVDHTEHDVDVVVTEQGLADLLGLDPMARASLIIDSCSHPEYRSELTHYLERARKKDGSRQPLVMEQAFSFHERFARNKSMKQ